MALINCPECKKEISDTAKICPHCGYKMNGNKNKVIIASVVIVAVLLAVFFLLKIGSSSVVGEWKIDHYITDDGNISQADIGEYYGEVYQTANSAFKVVFEKDGTATLYLPTYEGTETESRECDYNVEGSYIYLSVGSDTVKAFKIKGDTLIVYEVANFNGNVVLKKK